MKSDVIKMLAAARDYISGEAISDALGISRAAVWKSIHAVKEDGGEVEAVTNRGYRLKRLPDVLKPEYLAVYLDGPRDAIEWFESVDSTNTYLKGRARGGDCKSAIAIAEHQTGGKGRLGRHWQSGSGEAVQISFLLRPDILPAQAQAFNFAVSLGVCAAIERVCGIGAQIKWPNDVVYGTKKLCGILTEISSDMDRVEYLVSGAGLNVNQREFTEDIADRAVSLRMITGRKIDRLRLCAALIEEVEGCFIDLQQNGTGAMMGRYCEKSAVIGHEIRVICAGDAFEGICEGFGENGELIVKMGDDRRVFYAGEVSVRGVRDYV